MAAILKSEAIKALKEVFSYEQHKSSKEVIVVEKDNGDATFMVDKRFMERYEVIAKLQEFFSDKYINNGQCRIANITLLWTSFYIEDRT